MNLKPKGDFLIEGVRKDVSLKDYTTFKIGGPAKFFLEAENREQLKKAVFKAKELKIPIFVLGGGSNLLVSDEGFDGLVIKIESKKYTTENNKIRAESGVSLGNLAREALENELTGLEWAAGIPGTLGGAIRGNVAAFGNSMSDIISWVEFLDFDTKEVKRATKENCFFEGKDSVFKKKKNLVILEAEILLKKSSREEIKDKIQEYLKFREERHPLNFPSAGCVFKNQESRIKNQELLEEFPELEKFNKRGEIPAGFLIDKCGLKGMTLGGVQVSEKHANFIINLGGAKAEDVRALISLIKEKVKEKFGIELKEEIEYLGF